MKYIALLTFIAVVFIWLFNIQTLREVTELEKQLKTANETLDKIKRDMEAKGMKVTEEVVYFEIEE